MALELRIAGPGLDVTRRLEPGEPALILGRDAECTVCLPDPERNVSRRHLSVWNEADQLQFHVISVVNGVDMPFGEAPPGARGVLPVGQTLKIGDYALTVEAASGANAPAARDEDPWGALHRGGADFAPTQPAPFEAAGADAGDDPFGEWGFETTFGSDNPSQGGLQASSLAVAPDISAFYEGLGFNTQKLGVLSQGELEMAGRVVRLAILGVLELHKSVAGAKQELRSEDRTMLAPKGADKNPLKESDLDEEVVLQYLLGGRVAGAGYVGPERALREVMADLIVHEKASAAALRSALESVLKDFDPDVLKTRLLGGGGKLFESARAWDAFSKDYNERKENLSQWAQRLLDKYFAGAYLRESQRVKRDTGPRHH